MNSSFTKGKQIRNNLSNADVSKQNPLSSLQLYMCVAAHVGLTYSVIVKYEWIAEHEQHD